MNSRHVLLQAKVRDSIHPTRIKGTPRLHYEPG